mgnify:CR=1 FL=1
MGCEANVADIKDVIDGKSTVNGSNLLNIIRRLKDEDIIISDLFTDFDICAIECADRQRTI